MGKKKTAKITKGSGVKDMALNAARSVSGGAWYAKFDGVDGSLKAGASEVLMETVVAKAPAGSR
jgi:hypothetical protein